MSYEIYKNCQGKRFDILKVKLQKLKEKILECFSDKLRYRSRYDESDYLGLIFEIKDSKFDGSLAITFIDTASDFCFNLGFIKSIDIENVRYLKEGRIKYKASLNDLTLNIILLIEESLQRYSQLSLPEILEGDRIQLDN